MEKTVNLNKKRAIYVMYKTCYIILTKQNCTCNCSFRPNKIDHSNEPEFLQYNDELLENFYKLSDLGIKNIEIIDFGEPLLNKNIQKIINDIRKIILDVYIKLNTNGNNMMGNIKGINELNIFMDYYDKKNNNCDIYDIITEFKKQNSSAKITLTIPLIKDAVDSKKKLEKIINKTSLLVNEYVVKELSKNNNSYVSFDYNNLKVKFEKDIIVSSFNGLILASDNNFYTNWDLKNIKYVDGLIEIRKKDIERKAKKTYLKRRF